jgi:uncharacterized FAD-dependent dehydrogenase
MKKRYQVIIVGAGPAGLFAGYELLKKSFREVLLIDKGKSSSLRRQGNDVLSGIGGAGLFSDGKLNFTPRLGQTDLTEFLEYQEAEKLITETEEIFRSFGMDGETYPIDMELAETYRKKAKKLGFDLQIIKQKHLGTENLPGYIGKMENFLKEKGIEIETGSEVLGFIVKNKRVVGIKTDKVDILADNVLVAPGRAGNGWLTKELEKAGAKLEQKAIEVGVRVEVPAEVLQEICSTIYDPTFYLHTASFDDELRTFCTNPTGFVAEEKYKEFVCVNGHAYNNRQSANANFALLDKVSLSEPVTDTIAYGESICKLASTIGGGKPILQRYADFKRHRRSTWERLAKSYVEPTLKEVTPGDIGMALPYRVVVNLIEGIERLNEMLPGLACDSTLLYAPEVKFFSVRPKIGKNLETQIEGLFVAGDGAGVSGNIVGAAATGIIAARGIIAKGTNN